MIVEIKIGKSQYQIECSEIEKNKIINNAQKLDYRVNKLSQTLGNIDEKTLLILNSLLLQEENNKLINNKDSTTSSELDKFNEDEIYDAISENIDNINNYIEKLISRIQDY
jgi:cell division protein ZapA (FtsZ GTPase activity inhibitor)